MVPLNDRARALFVGRPRPFQGAFWTAVAVGISTALKFAIDSSLAGVPPFLTYFPAISLAALLLGWRWGAATLIASAGISDYYFTAPLHSWSLAANDLAVIILFLAAGGIIVATAEMFRGLSRRLQIAATRENELNAELKHRVNNTLAIVQALARQATRSTASDFYESFSDRLEALREAHVVLSSTEWVSCDLPRLAERGLKGVLPNGAISITGSPSILPPRSCVPLTLALHELSMNATKYGALSTPEGRVDVTWTIEQTRLVLRWIEHSGPIVSEPTRKGLGGRLLAAQQGLDQVVLEHLPEGVRCTISIDGALAA